MLEQHISQILTCNNICLRIRVGSAPRYKRGQKWCKQCEAAFETVKKFCECCGNWLRTKRHSGLSIQEKAKRDKQKWNENYKKKKGVDEIRKIWRAAHKRRYAKWRIERVKYWGALTLAR